MGSPPYRTHSVGSLIRSKYLVDAKSPFKQWLESDRNYGKEVNEAAARRAAKDAEHNAMAEVIAEQIKRGIIPLTSDEFERSGIS